MMKIPRVLLVTLLAFATRSNAYFEYALDCSPQCITKNQSCTISELSAASFPTDCMLTNADCEALAAPNIACLRKGEDVLGGQKIWPDYSTWAGRNDTPTTIAPAPGPTPQPGPGPTPQPGPGPTPPAPTPNPRPIPRDRKALFFEVYSLVLTAGIIMIGIGFGGRTLYQRWRDDSYEPLKKPETGRQLSPGSPYNQPTTVDL